MGRNTNQVRIIAGQWRGRKLDFPTIEGLRPTSDRIRETLFNWLTPLLPGAACLDLFAGSGALGFEAASRGATRVVMNDCDARVGRALRANGERLAAHQVEVVVARADDYLAGAEACFDIVFLDPPFARSELLSRGIARLSASGYLAPGAHIYIETAAQSAIIGIPDDWGLLKQKRAGAVDYRLYRCSGQTPGL